MKITQHNLAVIPGDTHISKWVEESGRLDHDQNMLPLVLQHIKPADTVIDIGAFIGDHTVAYSRAVGWEGTVYAFEPMPEAFECLEYNVGERGAHPVMNVTAYNIPLSYKEAGYRIEYSPNKGASRLVYDENEIILKTRTLDYFNFKWVDFIKIDAEGFEIDILEGGRQLIEKFKPKMLIEVNPGALQANGGKSVTELFSLLDDLGYVYRNIYAEQPMSGEQFDILCEKKI